MSSIGGILNPMGRFLCLKTFTSALAIAACADAVAGDCQKGIIVAAPPSGWAVSYGEDGKAKGVYVDLFERLSKQEGCKFKFVQASRAMSMRMVETTKEADIAIPANRSPDRDLRARFIRLSASAGSLMSLKSNPMEKSVPAILERSKAKGVFVEGYSFGFQYDQLVEKLAAQGRAYFVKDIFAAAMQIKDGRADFTIGAATQNYTTAASDPRLSSRLGDFAFEPIDGFHETEMGAYASDSLSEKDFETIRNFFAKAESDGSHRKDLERIFPKNILDLTVPPTRRSYFPPP